MSSSIKPVVVLTVICLVIVALLAFTFQYTKPFIEAAKEAATKEALTEVFPGDCTFTKLEDASFGWENVSAIYKADDAAGIAGYVFTVNTRGYGGNVEVMVGIDAAGAVTGVKVTEHSETPGLGAKAAVPEYLEQYKGMTESEPELISGATITSAAIKRAVQTALDAYGAKGGQG